MWHKEAGPEFAVGWQYISFFLLSSKSQAWTFPYLAYHQVNSIVESSCLLHNFDKLGFDTKKAILLLRSNVCYEDIGFQ